MLASLLHSTWELGLSDKHESLWWTQTSRESCKGRSKLTVAFHLVYQQLWNRQRMVKPHTLAEFSVGRWFSTEAYHECMFQKLCSLTIHSYTSINTSEVFIVVKIFRLSGKQWSECFKPSKTQHGTRWSIPWLSFGTIGDSRVIHTQAQHVH